jgi:hypothetical protein
VCTIAGLTLFQEYMGSRCCGWREGFCSWLLYPHINIALQYKTYYSMHFSIIDDGEGTDAG